MICSCELHKFDRFLLRILLNSWLRIFCSCSLIISLWLRACLKCCHRMKVDINIWLSWFLNRSFQFLNYILEICSYCHWLELLISVFSVFWAVELAFICWHLDNWWVSSKECVDSKFVEKIVRNCQFMRKLSNQLIIEWNQ